MDRASWRALVVSTRLWPTWPDIVAEVYDGVSDALKEGSGAAGEGLFFMLYMADQGMVVDPLLCVGAERGVKDLVGLK